MPHKVDKVPGLPRLKTERMEDFMHHLICAGLLPEHSFYPWHWDDERHTYTTECSVVGCSTKESTKDLFPGSVTRFLDSTGQPLKDQVSCDHVWGKWSSTADQFDLHKDEFRYRCICTKCKAEWQTTTLSAKQTRG